MANDLFIPTLEAHCGSWIVVNRQTREAVAEFYNRSTVEKINTKVYQVLTAQQYLAEFNGSIRQ